MVVVGAKKASQFHSCYCPFDGFNVQVGQRNYPLFKRRRDRVYILE
jgi:hypothetical protein